MLLAYLEEQKHEESDAELSRELSDLEGFYRAAKQPLTNRRFCQPRPQPGGQTPGR